jgi:hypothetical protein
MKKYNIQHKMRKAAAMRKEANLMVDGMGWQRAGNPRPKYLQ